MATEPVLNDVWALLEFPRNVVFMEIATSMAPFRSPRDYPPKLQGSFSAKLVDLLSFV